MPEPGRVIRRRYALRMSTPAGSRLGTSCQFRPPRVTRLVPRSQTRLPGSLGEPRSSTFRRQLD